MSLSAFLNFPFGSDVASASNDAAEKQELSFLDADRCRTMPLIGDDMPENRHGMERVGLDVFISYHFDSILAHICCPAAAIGVHAPAEPERILIW